MQKEDVISLITYVLMIGFAFAMGFGFVQPAIADGILGGSSQKGMLFLFLFLSVIIGLIIIAGLIEFSHFIGAKLGKYEVLSVNVFGFSLYKAKQEDGTVKIKFKFPRNFDGLTGETIIKPKSEQSKPIFYIFSPMFFFLIEVLITVMLFMFFPDDKDALTMMYVKYGSFIATTIGGMVIIYQYFPAKLDNDNDGFKLVSLNKKSNIEVFNEYLRIKACNHLNEDPGEIKTFDEINDFTARVNMLRVQRVMDSDYKSALEMIDKIVADPSKITKQTLNTVLLTKAYILFMNEDLETAKLFYTTELTEEQRKLCIACGLPLHIRVYLLYAALVEKSDSEVEIAMSRIKKALNKVPVGDKEQEEALINLVLEKIKK